MKIVKYPTQSEWAALLARPAMDTTSLFGTVQGVLNDIRSRGDEAVKEYELKFDKVELTSLQVTADEIAEAETLVSSELKSAILTAMKNIETFHAAQRFEGKQVVTMNGVTCWQKAVAIEKVGLYVPGGTAPLFSTVLMLAVPARIAGCSEIVLCTPPNREGKIHPAILFAAKSAGVNKVFKIGGIQAMRIPRFTLLITAGVLFVLGLAGLLIRRKLGLNQQQFWSKIGVTQSGGSRYESGRNMPKPVRELLRLVRVVLAVPKRAQRVRKGAQQAV